ncbi:hypothetical protein K2173_019235 [Erythroxylum novogranatense]|uniref:Uncharacterized protein n=1 Tax=Erythroxylum novogranatense TaxID=1862640 RepID=A0AAV8ST10_9ROSI|nr:hypothetical protein K2173_019235 [Erythroxylum novogranatense]
MSITEVGAAVSWLTVRRPSLLVPLEARLLVEIELTFKFQALQDNQGSKAVLKQGQELLVATLYKVIDKLQVALKGEGIKPQLVALAVLG